MVLRPAQEAILKYQGGRMAVSAVPGSGKTFTLSLLAAELIRQHRIDVQAGQQVLVVTYLNSSVDTFRARIRQRLEVEGLPLAGFEVRTLHSLALEIGTLAQGGATVPNEGPNVLDEPQALNLLTLATDVWIDSHPRIWQELLSDVEPQQLVRWREIIEHSTQAFIREAKNHRYHPEAIAAEIKKRLYVSPENSAVDTFESMITQGNLESQLWLPVVAAGIYQHYQAMLARQGALDFDDLIWQAADLLSSSETIAADFRSRWPYILEDEAQDSVPLQEALLDSLSGQDGNWVRVGDPNQAITSTFTAADPRRFTSFMNRPDVSALPLPNSGRCAPRIYGAANKLVDWVSKSHPVPEVRSTAFLPQDILPTPPGDMQPNPTDTPSNFQIKVFRHREDDELPAIAQLSTKYIEQHPAHTVAILVPTNDLGHRLSTRLDSLGTSYDDLLRGGTRVREIAFALHWMLRLFANPLDSRALEQVYAALLYLDHPVLSGLGGAAHDRIRVLLRSVHLPELLLYGTGEEEKSSALPLGVAAPIELAAISKYIRFVVRTFQYRSLPIDDLILSLSDELFALESLNNRESRESDRATAYELATSVRRWWDVQPEWRLPDLAVQLGDVATGRLRLRLSGVTALGYNPEPGRITLATQHSAKGMEWDAVFLVGIDSFWMPNDLDGHFLGVDALFGGDPSAEVCAQLHALMKGDAGVYPGRSATESAHIEIISERLRLLYTGITRARRFLQISRSRKATRGQKDFTTEPATVMGVLYQYLKENSS